MGKFWLGFTLAFCWQEAIEDYLGKDRFLELTRVLWVDTKWWYWPILFSFCLVLHFAGEKLARSDFNALRD